MNGLVLIDKEEGFTSFDAVAVVRRIFETRKAGHGGTLDPNATGLLPVFLGNACALSSLILGGDKVYEAELLLGRSTDTDDIWGETREEAEVNCTEKEVREAILSFVGTYEQIPPMYSAKKTGGKKLYELARKGIEVERKAVPVTIREVEILRVELPRVRFRIRCEKGTYIRALCRDIGEKLGVPAVMSALRRTQHGSFTVTEAHTLRELQAAKDSGTLPGFLIPADQVLSEYPALHTKKDCDRLLLNGNMLLASDLLEEEELAAFIRKMEMTADFSPRFRMYDADGAFRALYRFSTKNNGLVPEKMFLNGDR